MTRFAFEYDDFTDVVSVSVSDMLLTDANGDAALVAPHTPVEALTPAVAKAFAVPLAHITELIAPKAPKAKAAPKP